jgi:hypothetical protein
VLPQSPAQSDFGVEPSFFFSYQPEAGVEFERTPAASGVQLRALAGDVRLENDTSAVFAAYGKSGNSSLAAVYPANLDARAYGGDLVLTRGLELYPDARAQLSLLAAASIVGDPRVNLGSSRLVMSDQDPLLLPRVTRPFEQPVDGDLSNGHAAVPLHAEDSRPVLIIARDGDIGLTSGSTLGLYLAKPVLLQAGRDVVGLDLRIQHNRPGDVSLLQAGRDLFFLTRRSGGGGLSNSQQGIQIAGPGELLVSAARDIDLGTSQGLISIGDTGNLALPDSGASITLIGGADGARPLTDITRLPVFANLADFYFDPTEDPVPADAAALELLEDGVLTFSERLEVFAARLDPVRDDITGYLRQLSGDATLDSDAAIALYIALQSYQRSAAAFVRTLAGDAALPDPQALARFELLPAQERIAPLLATLFGEVQAGGVSGSAGGGYEQASNAIDGLYLADAPASGELRLLISQVTTLDGGDINLLTPYGGVNAGISSTSQLEKSSDELGVIVRGKGDINTVVRDTLQVNSTRVFALDGGDITVWATQGNIDAGSGENPDTAVATRDVQLDRHGNALITFPPTVSTAGIRSIVSSADTAPGDVFLFAPQGIIDAGDAGIGAAGNLTLAATQVIGADNIDVGGVSVGVPTAPAGPPPGLAGVSALAASVAKQAQESAGSVGEGAAEQEAELALLNIDVLGFGEEEEDQ